ncbi:MAG: sulfite exporter TauE/SafE family protein [Burkholderiaceae bacterium]
MPDSIEATLLVGLAFLFAGIVKGTIGMGLPTTLISVLAQWLDPRVAVALLLIPAILTNIWQVIRAGRFLDSVRALWPFAIVLTVTIWPATRIAAAMSRETIAIWVGVMIVVFASVSLLRAPPTIPARLDKLAQVLAGAVAGGIGGITSIWSPPMVVYLLGRGVDKNDFVRMAGFLIIVGTIPLTFGYWNAGLLDRSLAVSSTFMIAPVLAGFAIGERIRHRLDPQLFRRGVLVFFFLMGLNLVRRAF